MRIDTHQHFWVYTPQRDKWITDQMTYIQRDFLPRDFEGTLEENQVDGIISVQTVQSHEETRFLVEQAKICEKVVGVIGWVDLRSEKVEE